MNARREPNLADRRSPPRRTASDAVARGDAGSRVPAVALATWEKIPDLDPDDGPLVAALSRHDVDVHPTVWSDPGVDWSRFDLAVIRSTWDYYNQLPAFLDWLEHVSTVSSLLNPCQTVRWNIDKHYLRDLGSRGIPIVPTVWLQQGADVRLDALLDERGWTDVIIKPTVSATSHGLFRVCDGAVEGDPQRRLEGLLRRGAVMVQAFQRSVESQGETSIVWIDGHISHAVRKLPREGDFRAQPEYGCETRVEELSAEERKLADRVMRSITHPASYARVDVVRRNDATLSLIELELIEPRLYFREHESTALRMAEMIVSRLCNRS